MLLSLPLYCQRAGVDKNTVDFFISTLSQQPTDISLVLTGGQVCLFLPNLHTFTQLLLCSCAGAGGVVGGLPHTDMSIFLLCSFLKGSAWSVFADHIRCRILKGSLYQVKQGVCTPNLLSGWVFKFAAGCCTLSSPSTGSVRTIALLSPRSSSWPVSASAHPLQGHLRGPTFPFLLSGSWGPIIPSLKLGRGVDWALQGLLRCFPPDGADS